MPGRVKPWIARTLLGILIAFLAGAAGVFWIRAKAAEVMEVPHAIYATGQLLEYCHSFKRQHGEWPPSGFVARDVGLVRTYTDKGVRVDAFNYGRGQYALFYFHRDRIEVFAVRTVPTTSPTGAAP